LVHALERYKLLKTKKQMAIHETKSANLIETELLHINNMHKNMIDFIQLTNLTSFWLLFLPFFSFGCHDFDDAVLSPHHFLF